MPCKALATYPETPLSNGLFILRTARPSVHSTCSGNFIIWRKSTCVIAAQKQLAIGKLGVRPRNDCKQPAGAHWRSRLDYEEMVAGSFRGVGRSELGRSVAAKH